MNDNELNAAIMATVINHTHVHKENDDVPAKGVGLSFDDAALASEMRQAFTDAGWSKQ